MSNNPFAVTPAERYPPVSSIGTSASPIQPLQSFSPPPQQGYQTSSFLQPQLSQQPLYTGIGTSTGGSGFQPQTSFGQQLQTQYTGMPMQQTGYYGAQQPPFQQSTFSTGYVQPQAIVSDLDPYSSLGNTPFSQQQQPSYFSPQNVGATSSYSTPSVTSTPSVVRLPDDHPRSYVQNHKAELDKWDNYTWKQLENRFGDLAKAWEDRKGEIKTLFGWRIDQPGVQRRTQLEKEVEDNVGQIYASKFQVIEVRDSYRHSTDPASRGRVRTAINEGLRGLPEWPKRLEEQEREMIMLGEQIRSGQIQLPPAQNNQQNQGLFDSSIAQSQGYQQTPQQQWNPGYGQPQNSFGVQQQPSFQQPQPTGFYGGNQYQQPQQQQQQQPYGLGVQPTGYGGGWSGNQVYRGY